MKQTDEDLRYKGEHHRDERTAKLTRIREVIVIIAMVFMIFAVLAAGIVGLTDLQTQKASARAAAVAAQEAKILAADVKELLEVERAQAEEREAVVNDAIRRIVEQIAIENQRSIDEIREALRIHEGEVVHGHEILAADIEKAIAAAVAAEHAAIEAEQKAAPGPPGEDGKDGEDGGDLCILTPCE